MSLLPPRYSTRLDSDEVAHYRQLASGILADEHAGRRARPLTFHQTESMCGHIAAVDGLSDAKREQLGGRRDSHVASVFLAACARGDRADAEQRERHTARERRDQHAVALDAMWHGLTKPKGP
jgi:hypothetical protein